MKWDNTQRLIDSSFELTMLAIKYCGNLCIVNNKGEETPLDRKRPKQLDKNDVKFAYDLCMSLNTDSVVNEIESHLTGDYDNNKLIFKVFFGKIAKRCNCLPLLFGASDWNVKAPKDWMKIGGWEQYMTSCKDIKMFVWLIGVCLRDKFDYLIREVQSLADTYDLVFDESDSEESEIETITVAKNKKSQTFSDIIQYDDKGGRFSIPVECAPLLLFEVAKDSKLRRPAMITTFVDYITRNSVDRDMALRNLDLGLFGNQQQ